jgi:predicted ATPase/DNA-binding XRE family transcriptional regulator
MNVSPKIATTTFGDFLKRLRKRAGMTQDDLAAATGYSASLISALEHNRRLPDVEAVSHTYLPALHLRDEPLLATQLVELAAKAHGEEPPPSLVFLHQHSVLAEQEGNEEAYCIPVPPTRIIGRVEEIQYLCDCFLGRRGRLLTLVGPPGVGKTRLAEAVGIELQSFYRDGACFISLAAVSDPTLVASSLLSSLRLQEGLARSPQARLIEHLRRKEVLLLLDNFEQLMGGDASAVELVAELLAECPGLCILVTSRERLHLRSEQRYHVEPLALPAAVELFVERCSAVDAGFTLTDANRLTIEAICEQLDRLPLALELCAAQIDLLSPAQLLEHLPPSRFAEAEDASGERPAHAIPKSGARPAGPQDRRFELLVDGAQDLPLRQRTLKNAIAHSYELLDAGERRLLRSLGVFVGGCDLEGIEAVSRWSQEEAGRPLLQTLHALVGKSLVRAETTPEGARRYLLLETIREFALAQARAEREEDVQHQRHYAAYLQLFRTGDAGLRGPEATTWLARLEPEHDNLRAALQWSLDGGRYEDAAWLMLAAAWFWFHTGRWQETARWIARLLPHRDTLSAAQRLAILIDLYRVSRASEEFQPFDRYRDELMDLLEVCPDMALHAAAWHLIAAYSADLPEASARWERSIACARAAREEAGLPPSLLAETKRVSAPLRGSSRGRPADALPASDARPAELPPTLSAAPPSVSGGRPARELSKSETRSAGLGPEFGVVTDRDYVLATPLRVYAHILSEHGEFERAAPLLAESARLFQARGSLHRMADVVGTQGRLAMLQGDIERAQALLREAVTLGKALNYQFVLGDVQSILGLVTLYRGDVPQARQLLGDSLRVCLDLNDRWFLGRVCTYLAELALWEGKLDAAESWLAQGIAYHGDRRLSRMDHLERVMVAARLATAQGAYQRAATLFGLAIQMCSDIHYELAGPARQLADDALAQVRAALAPERFAEAYAAGQQLSLDEALGTIVAPGVATGLPGALPQPAA